MASKRPINKKTAAYDILSDPEKRTRYDRGENGEQSRHGDRR